MKKEYEVQRYGRNKHTSVNFSYICSGEYRNKFDLISDNNKLNRKVYQLAKKMLRHRSGTSYEDMYWLDISSAQIVASEISQQSPSKIQYSKSTRHAIRNHKNLLAVHTHPSSMPPSVGDFNSALRNNYRVCIVCCHNGKLFMYRSHKYIIEFFYKSTIAKYKHRGYNDYEAQIKTLIEFEEHKYITFKEVNADEITRK